MKPETKFRVNLVNPFLKKLKNCVAFSIQQVAIVGDPDIILCIHGRFVGLELKDVGEVPRKIQKYKLEKITNSGGLSIVADRDNWGEVSSLLQKMDNSEEFAWKVLKAPPQLK